MSWFSLILKMDVSGFYDQRKLSFNHWQPHRRHDYSASRLANSRQPHSRSSIASATVTSLRNKLRALSTLTSPWLCCQQKTHKQVLAAIVTKTQAFCERQIHHMYEPGRFTTASEIHCVGWGKRTRCACYQLSHENHVCYSMLCSLVTGKHIPCVLF